jgi:membrane protein DedA with SNARE-associated domain
MAEFLAQVVVWLEAFVLAVGYPGIFLVMFIENLFPPVPTDPFLPLAGLAAAQGYMSPWLLWVAAFMGATVGALVLYGIGRWAEAAVIRRLIQRYGRYVLISEATLDRALALFNRNGMMMVFFGRYVPVLRSAVSLAAGMSRLPIPLFAAVTLVNAAINTGFWLLVGYMLGENWGVIMPALGKPDTLIPLLIVAALGIAIIVLVVRVVARAFNKQVEKFTSVPPTTDAHTHDAKPMV